MRVYKMNSIRMLIMSIMRTREFCKKPVIREGMVINFFLAWIGKNGTVGALVAGESVILMGHPRTYESRRKQLRGTWRLVRFQNACPIDSTRRNRIPLIANLWRRV